MVIFPPRLPQSYNIFQPVSSLSHLKDRALLIRTEGFDYILPASEEEDIPVHIYCMCFCVLKEGKLAFVYLLVLNKATRSWQHISREGGGEILVIFCWRKCQHASVCLPIGTKSSYIPADSCQGCKEAAKKARREVSRKKTRGGREERRRDEGREERRREEEAIWSSAFTITQPNVEMIERLREGFDLFLKGNVFSL